MQDKVMEVLKKKILKKRITKEEKKLVEMIKTETSLDVSFETLLGRRERHRYNVATMFCCPVGCCISLWVQEK